MRVLLDHDVPHGLRSQFSGEYEVVTAQYQGWENYDDDQLLAALTSPIRVGESCPRLVTAYPIE